MDNSAGNKRIALNTLFLYIRMGLVLVITLITTRVVMKALGIDDFGIYGVVCGFVSLFGVFNTTFTSGINRFYNFAIGKKEVGGVRKVYKTSLVIQVILAIATLILVEVIGLWYINYHINIPAERLEIANWIFQFAVVSLLVIILQTPYLSAVMAYEKMNFYAIVSIADVSMKLLIVFLLPSASIDKLLLYGFLMMFVSIISFVMYFIYAKVKFSEIRYQKGFDKGLFKSMLSFSGWTLLDPVAYTIRGQGCNLALNSFFGPVLNAAYTVANQVASGLDQFGNNIIVAFRPQIVQSYSAGEYSRTKHLMTSVSKINFVLQLMLTVPLILEMDYVLHLWLGETIPDYVIPFTCLILVVKNINTLNSPITFVIMATGKIKKYMICTSIIVSSTLLFSILFFALGFSPVSMYIVMVGVTIVNQAVCIHLLCQNFEHITLGEYLKTIVWPCLRQTLLMPLLPIAVWFLLPPSFWRLIVVCLASLVSSVFVAYKLNLDHDERNIITSIVKNFINKIRK